MQTMLRWEWDVVVCWESGDRYWVDVHHGEPLCKAVVRCWRSEVPLAVHWFHRLWIMGKRRGEWRMQAMSYLKRKAVSDQVKQKAAAADHGEWLAKHPALGEYLTSEEYPDGGKRTTATLLLFVEAGEVKACLRDRDTDMSLWVSARSVPAVLEALDAVLQTEEPGWRKNQPYNGNGKRKK